MVFSWQEAELGPAEPEDMPDSQRGFPGQSPGSKGGCTPADGRQHMISFCSVAQQRTRDQT